MEVNLVGSVEDTFKLDDERVFNRGASYMGRETLR